MTDTNKDIFYKATKNTSSTQHDIYVSSSLFTTSTPSKQIINNISESHRTLNNKLDKLHNDISNENFLPIGTDMKTEHANQHRGGYSTETINIPKNSPESTISITPYKYDIEYEQYSSTSSESSEEPKKRKRQSTNKRGGSKKGSINKGVAKKGSTTKSVIKNKNGSKKGSRKGSRKGSKKVFRRGSKKVSRKGSNEASKK